jgi:AAA domain
MSDPEQAKTSPKTLTAPELMALELPEAKQIIPGILYEGSNLIAAPPKMGKTYCALGLGVAIASGGRALGVIEVEQGDVLGLFLEDGRRRLRDRLRTMLKGSSAPERFTLAMEWPRLDEGGLEAIKSWIDQKENPSLVIIDTLKRVRPCEHVNRRLYDLDYDAVAPLTDLAHKTSIAFLINHHTRKMQSDDHIDMASGSLGLTGAVDAVLTLKRSRGEADATLCVSGRDCEDKELALRWDAALTQWNLLGDANEYNKSKARREVTDLLKTGDKPLTPSEVAELLGKEHSATKKLLWSMGRDGELKSSDGRYYLPPSNNGNHGNQVTAATNSTPGYSVTTVTEG